MQLQHQSQLSTTACTACTACTAFRIRQRARTHAPAHPTRSDAQGTEGWEREELYRAHAHTCGHHSDGTNCNRYLTSAIHVPSLSRAKSSAWVVAAGRLLCLAEPHTPARVFLGPAHRTLGGPHRCVFNNPIIPTHLPLLRRAAQVRPVGARICGPFVTECQALLAAQSSRSIHFRFLALETHSRTLIRNYRTSRAHVHVQLHDPVLH